MGIKIKTACDKNKDGVIDKTEFAEYYDKICKEMQEHHKAANAEKSAAKKEAGLKPRKLPRLPKLRNTKRIWLPKRPRRMPRLPLKRSPPKKLLPLKKLLLKR